MKSNYETPQVILVVFNEDVITTSIDEATGGFDKGWLDSSSN